MVPNVWQVHALGWLHVLMFGVLLPLAALRHARGLTHRVTPLPPRLLHFRSTSATLSIFLAMSIATAMVQRIPVFSSRVPHVWRGLTAAIVMYAAAILFMRPRWRAAVARRARAVHLFIADTGTERAWWLLVSLLAGIGEEVTWRGVQTGLLTLLTGNYWIASVLSGASFAATHAVQGWRSALGIFLFALGFQTVVTVSGSLFFAMAVHVAYDISVGLAYGRLAREMGYVPEP
jgi:hypothetical protein